MSAHSRRPSLRLEGYDYSAAGAYFVTVCVRRRVRLLGEVRAGEMHLNRAGLIVRDEWFKSAAARPEVGLREDELVIMPDHVHGIIWLDYVGGVGSEAPLDVSPGSSGWPPEPESRILDAPPRARRPAAPTVLGNIIGQFKSIATKRINSELDTPGVSRWQRGYYDRIIRNEAGLARIREYIRDNPARWSVRGGR